MDAKKRKRLEDAGFRVGTVAEFLGLSPEESELVEIRIALTSALKKQRSISNLSQSQLAEQIGSSQSRVAKMESGDPHISLDLMIRALLAAGMTRNGVAEAMVPQPVSVPQVRVSITFSQDDKDHYTFKTRPQSPTTGNNPGDRKTLGA